MSAADSERRLGIADVVALTGMTASRIRYYEGRGLIAQPERVSGKRRYAPEVLRRLAFIDAAQRIGFTLDEVADLLADRGEEPAHERVRELALLKLPEIERLIERATQVRRLLELCSTCTCESIDECPIFNGVDFNLG
jgi:MerR family redox-sensitive transcriptional activator SoxR